MHLLGGECGGLIVRLRKEVDLASKGGVLTSLIYHIGIIIVGG